MKCSELLWTTVTYPNDFFVKLEVQKYDSSHYDDYDDKYEYEQVRQ